MYFYVFPYLLFNIFIYKFYFQFTFKNKTVENHDGINSRGLLQNVRGNVHVSVFFSLYIFRQASCRIAKFMFLVISVFTEVAHIYILLEAAHLVKIQLRFLMCSAI